MIAVAAHSIYTDATPGFIFTGIIVGLFALWVVGIYIHNFGPAAKRRAAADGLKQRDTTIQLP